MDQLRATFIAGPSSGLTAQETFTDRIGEVEAFRRGVEAVLRASAAASNGLSMDVTAPRRNVMVYYGLGGIGKTALSKQLERRVLDGTVNGGSPLNVWPSDSTLAKPANSTSRHSFCGFGPS